MYRSYLSLRIPNMAIIHEGINIGLFSDRYDPCYGIKGGQPVMVYLSILHRDQMEFVVNCLLHVPCAYHVVILQ